MDLVPFVINKIMDVTSVSSKRLH